MLQNHPEIISNIKKYLITERGRNDNDAKRIEVILHHDGFDEESTILDDIIDRESSAILENYFLTSGKDGNILEEIKKIEKQNLSEKHINLNDKKIMRLEHDIYSFFIKYYDNYNQYGPGQKKEDLIKHRNNIKHPHLFCTEHDQHIEENSEELSYGFVREIEILYFKNNNSFFKIRPECVTNEIKKNLDCDNPDDYPYHNLTI